MSANSKKKGTFPKWWKEEPDGPTKLLIKQALANYIVKNGLKDNLPTAIKSVYLAILPEMGKLDERWKKVNEENFEQGKYPAHASFG